jgi:ribosome biogenesis GTPase
MPEKIIKIEDLGYDEFFEANRKKLRLELFPIARVIAERRGGYRVKNIQGEYLAKIMGKQIWNAKSREDYPAVGDWVSISKVEEDKATIQGVLPRRTIMQRKFSSKDEIQIIATNIDVVFIIEAVGRDYNLNRYERYFAMANDGGIKPAIILNKIDLISNEELKSKLDQIKDRFRNVDVIATSTVNNSGLDELKKYITKGKTYCFLGSSGVGKSSLINCLLCNSEIKTGEIGSFSGRGKHVTTAREMYFLKQGGIVIDNPGVREVGMTDANSGVDNIFDEITSLSKKCKFINCTHVHEPGCEVLLALKSGELNKDKYSNFVSLKKETKHFKMTKI